MTERWLARAFVSALLVAPGAATAADEPAPLPDDEFLEYLGSWEGDDADWLVAQGPAGVPAQPSPPGARGEKDSKGEGDRLPPQEQ